MRHWPKLKASTPRRSPVGMAVWLGVLAAGLPTLLLAAPPELPSTGAINARLEAIQALPLPTPDALEEGSVHVGVASEERRLRRGFLELQQAQPAWRDEGIVIASGRHRLEAVAASLERPDLLSCDGLVCRLQAPLAVESGATLIIDQLTVMLEQETGSALVVFGDLFANQATIQGRNGDRLATSDGTRYRPFIVAYDESRTVIRDSRLVALGFDSFGTTGLAVMTASRDAPVARPELSMASTLVEDVYDGVFVRGGGKVELLRNIVTGTGRHGIVVRDDTSDVLIAENVVTGSGATAENGNGIVVSRGAGGAVLAANRVENSAAAGILVERGVVGLIAGANELIGNGRDGLIVYESSAVALTGNRVIASGRSGIRVRSSDDITITDNVLQRNARSGVDAHDWSAATREPNDEERPLIRPTVVTVTGNRFAENTRGPCLFEGVVTVLPANGSDC